MLRGDPSGIAAPNNTSSPKRHGPRYASLKCALAARKSSWGARTTPDRGQHLALAVSTTNVPARRADLQGPLRVRGTPTHILDPNGNFRTSSHVIPNRLCPTVRSPASSTLTLQEPTPIQPSENANEHMQTMSHSLLLVVLYGFYSARLHNYVVISFSALHQAAPGQMAFRLFG